MDVENAIAERGHKLFRQQPHVTGQANQIYAVRAQAGDYVGVVLLALAAFRNEHCVRQT